MWRLQTKLVQLFAAVALLIVALSIGKDSAQILRVDRYANGVDQGSNAWFMCQTRADHRPVAVKHWEVNDSRLEVNASGVSSNGRLKVSPPYNYALLVHNSQPEDNGKYTCVAKINGKIHRGSTQFTVFRPIETFPVSVVRAVNGRNCIMKCNGKYYREIVWLRNKERIVEQQPDRFSSPGSGSLLFITKVTMADSGSYVCQFVSLRLAYRDVELLVVDPMTRVVASSLKPAAETGHSLQLRCRANGYPPPDRVQWFNGSALIQATDRVSFVYDPKHAIAILTIHVVTRFDSGIYNCTYQQELESKKYHYLSDTVSVVVFGKPDPARDVVPTLQGLLGVHAVFKVHLSWKTPIYTGHLKMLAYRVVYWNKKMCKNYPSNCASMQEYWLDSSRLSHNFTFPKYRGSTTICFVVQSVNTNGLSKPSDRACTSFIPTPVKIPTRKSHIATTEGLVHPTSTQVPATSLTMAPEKQRNFQLLMESKEELCSGSLQVDETMLSEAIAALFSWLCSCHVPTSSVKMMSGTQFGGILLFHGSVYSPDADHLLNNLSSYIQTGPRHPHIQLDGSYLTFLRHCPTAVQNRDSRCILDEDIKTVMSCSMEITTTSLFPTVLFQENVESSWSLLQIGLVSGIGAVAVIFVFAFMCLLHFQLHADRNAKSRCQEKHTRAVKPTGGTSSMTDSISHSQTSDCNVRTSTVEFSDHQV